MTLLALLAVPAPPAAARQEEGRILQWYQHYERGLASADRGEWGSALEDFAAAARVRRQPAERARTYGTRFLVDYDPAYQQARCLVALGRLDEAERLLAQAEASAVTDERALAALRGRIAERRAEEARVADRASGERVASAPPPTGGGEAVREGSSPPSSPVATARPVALPQEAEAEVGSGAAERRPSDRPPAGAEDEPPTRPVDRAVPAAPDSSLDAAADPAGDPAELPETSAAPEGAAGAAEAVEPTVPALAESPGGEPVPSRAPLAVVGGAGGLLAALAVVLLLRRRRPAQAPGRSTDGTLPRRIGDFRVSGELGRGGMATTYRAERVRDGLPVAIKVPHETGDPTYRERFLREGRLGETLHHPRIVRIVEAGEDGGRPYLALELIPGQTLRAMLDESTVPLPPGRAVAIVRDIAEALDYAHGKGVVHRDLKPENVMLLPDGTVKVMDFGVARIEGQPGLTTSRFFFGSPVYAAPELVDPPSVDLRADLYSLGVILFELLEGRPPFVHESVFKLLEMHQREPLPTPESLPRPLPPEVWRVLRRLLEKDPGRRYPSAQALLVDLDAILYEPSGATGSRRTEARPPQ